MTIRTASVADFRDLAMRAWAILLTELIRAGRRMVSRNETVEAQPHSASMRSIRLPNCSASCLEGFQMSNR